ncbi:ferritin-like domain-containing protein [Mesorhizobium sp. M0166]|uniref:ferritin-like domain-containing protein n=1 Tax=Mesorhizobium sp. M0166 TaxID=2956902 RepID=UPI003338EBF6
MNIHDSFLLDGIEPEVGQRINYSSRDVLAKFSKIALVGSAPVLLAMASTEAFAGGLPQQVVDILNFALTLEYFEANFYKTANASKGLIPAKYRGLFVEIGRHEHGHVELLKGVLGSVAVAPPEIDFTGGGKYPDVFFNFKTFSTLSSSIEDIGVAAFKGQAGNLAGTPVLTTALQIHSVEARHAGSVRVLVGKPGSDGAFDKPMTKEEVLEAVKPFLG